MQIVAIVVSLAFTAVTLPVRTARRRPVRIREANLIFPLLLQGFADSKSPTSPARSHVDVDASFADSGSSAGTDAEVFQMKTLRRDSIAKDPELCHAV